jgi:thioester reductase-like protein
MWEFYNDKVIFLTGGTGFVGTTILYRLFTQATPRRVFVLTRGGHKYV